MSNDEGSLRGKGLGAMLPSSGNPFQPAGGAPKAANVDPAAAPDLTPEELSRLFPDGPAPSLMNAETGGGGDEGLPAWITGAPAAATTSSTMPTAGAVVVTEDVAPEAAMELPIAERPTGRQMFDPEIMFYGLEIKPDEIGPQATRYEEAKALDTDEGQLKLFVSDDLLMKTWSDVAELEAEIVNSRRISGAPGNELLDRLRNARNLLLNGRDKYEEAQQEIARVHFRFTRIRKIEVYEEAPFVFGWVIATLVLVVVGFANINNLTAFTEPIFQALKSVLQIEDQSTFSGAVFWSSVWFGAAGGVTGAFYALWTHVANKKDYDPEFAIWYYTNPIMGLLMGAFAFMFSNVGVVTFASPLAIFIIAFALGFQQNLFFGLINGLIKRLLPTDDKDKPAEA